MIIGIDWEFDVNNRIEMYEVTCIGKAIADIGIGNAHCWISLETAHVPVWDEHRRIIFMRETTIDIAQVFKRVD
jgi:hypothetical protein